MAIRDEYGLTPKQRIWADTFIETGNAMEADRRAGYKQRMDRQNTQIPAIKQYIDMRMQPTAEKRIASADEVLQFLTDVMMGRVKDQFGLDASLQDRTNAAKELMKRYAVADQRQQGTMQKLDAILLEFTTALQAPSAPASSADAIETTVTDGE
jgi:phage terminase small subunit